jgi:hypothetical protein
MNTLLASLDFHGPFTFVDRGRGIATSGHADSAGIYLWVLRDGERRFVHYVGETVRFLTRQKEHLTQILGLNYGIYRADAVAADDPAPIFRGMWRDRSADPMTPTLARWPELQDAVLAYVDALEVFFAPTGTLPVQDRKHLEACIARQLRERHPHEARFYPADNRTIPRSTKGARIAIRCAVPVMGLDVEVSV